MPQYLRIRTTVRNVQTLKRVLHKIDYLDFVLYNGNVSGLATVAEAATLKGGEFEVGGHNYISEDEIIKPKFPECFKAHKKLIENFESNQVLLFNRKDCPATLSTATDTVESMFVEMVLDPSEISSESRSAALTSPDTGKLDRWTVPCLDSVCCGGGGGGTENYIALSASGINPTIVKKVLEHGFKGLDQYSKV